VLLSQEFNGLTKKVLDSRAQLAACGVGALAPLSEADGRLQRPSNLLHVQRPYLDSAEARMCNPRGVHT
jgi:hypothetical protein